MPKAKDNPFSDNPFDKSSATVPAVPGYSNGEGAWGGGGGGGASSYQSAPAVIGLDDGFSRKQEQLELKEKELKAKEAELRKLEADLKATGALKPSKNWPRCCPITHHDIAGEIPAGEQTMVRSTYWSYLGLVLCMTFNLFGTLCALFAVKDGSAPITAFFLAAVYWFAGVPGAWILWYMRIYNAAQKNRAFTYMWFFVMYAIHLIFCIWSAVSPPMPFTNAWSHTGFLTGIKAFGDNTFVAIVYIIGGVLWSLESLWSFWVLKLVLSNFRGGGGDRRLKQELAAAQTAATVAYGTATAGARTSTNV